MTDNKSRDHFTHFRSAIPNNVQDEQFAKYLFLLSAFPKHIDNNYGTHFESQMPPTLKTKLQDYAVKSSQDLNLERWIQVANTLDAGQLGQSGESMASFLNKHPKVNELVQSVYKVRGQKERIEKQWTPLHAAKLYLSLYQEDYETAVSTLVPSLRYDAINAVVNFKRKNPVIDSEELASITGTLLDG